MESFINKCRICLSDDERPTNCLFKDFDQGVTLQELFTNTLGIEIDPDDGLPTKLCQTCTSIIVDFYNLKAIYEENSNQLRAIMNTSEVNLLKKYDLAQETAVVENSVEVAAPQNAIKIEYYSSDDENELNEFLKTQSKGDSNMQVGNTIKTYNCPECSLSFTCESDVHTHMLTTHEVYEIKCKDLSELGYFSEDKLDEVNLKCKFCSNYFPDAKSLNEHLDTHKTNVCNICGLGFSKKSYLKDHKEIHSQEKRHICNFCHKAFKRRTVLVKHKRIHTNPRESVCEVCGKAFNDKGTLKTHIMLIHTKEKNYLCLICGFKFPLKGSLEKHIERHQKKMRNFSCTQCDLAYKDKSSLDRHINVKHSGKNTKSTCVHCGKQYTTLGNLLKHQRSQHANVKDES